MHENIGDIYRIAYVGPGISGRTTALESVLRQSLVPPERDARGVRFELSKPSRTVYAFVSSARAHYWRDPSSRDLPPGRAEEIELIRGSAAVIFVWDAQAACFERNCEQLELLYADLAGLAKPIVALVNKDDLPEQSPKEVIEAKLGAVRHIRGIANRGVGPMAILDIAIAEAAAWRARPA